MQFIFPVQLSPLVRIPRPRCMLERTHKLFGLSLSPQPNAVIILASTKRPMQILPPSSR